MSLGMCGILKNIILTLEVFAFYGSELVVLDESTVLVIKLSLTLTSLATVLVESASASSTATVLHTTASAHAAAVLHLVLCEPVLVGLVAVEPLLGLECKLLLLVVHDLAWLSELDVSVSEVALVAKGTVLVGFVVPASLGLVLVIDVSLLAVLDVFLHRHIVVHTAHLVVALRHLHIILLWNLVHLLLLVHLVEVVILVHILHMVHIHTHVRWLLGTCSHIIHLLLGVHIKSVFLY